MLPKSKIIMLERLLFKILFNRFAMLA